MRKWNLRDGDELTELVRGSSGKPCVDDIIRLAIASASRLSGSQVNSIEARRTAGHSAPGIEQRLVSLFSE